MDFNQAIVIGHLGKDPESRFTATGDAVTNFRLATSESYTAKSGEKVEKTEWHSIVMFGKVAEIAAKYLKKGSGCLVEGKIQTRKWQDKDGNDRYSTEIVGHKLQLGDRPSGERDEPAPQRARNEAPKGAAKKGAADDLDDDIPF